MVSEFCLPYGDINSGAWHQMLQREIEVRLQLWAPTAQQWEAKILLYAIRVLRETSVGKGKAKKNKVVNVKKD